MKLVELIKFAADNRVEAIIDNDEVNFYTFNDDGERFRQISIHPDVLLEKLLDISGFEVELA
jgi:hypothetical protein